MQYESHRGLSPRLVYALNVAIVLLVIFWVVGWTHLVFIPMYVPVQVIASVLIVALGGRLYIRPRAAIWLFLACIVLAMHAGGAGSAKVGLLFLLLASFVNWFGWIRARLGDWRLIKSVLRAGEIALFIAPGAYLAELFCLGNGLWFPVYHDHPSRVAGLFGEPSHVGLTLGPWYAARVIFGRRVWRFPIITDLCAVALLVLVPSTTLILSIVVGLGIKLFRKSFGWGYLIVVPLITLSALFLADAETPEVRAWFRRGRPEGSIDVLVAHTLLAAKTVKQHPLGVGLFQYADAVPDPEELGVDPIFRWSGTDGSSLLPYGLVTLGLIFAMIHIAIGVGVLKWTRTMGPIGVARAMLLAALLLSYSRWTGPMMGSILALGALAICSTRRRTFLDREGGARAASASQAKMHLAARCRIFYKRVRYG